MTRVLKLEYTDDNKIANCEYRFPQNGYGYVDEIFVRFQFYPTGFDLNQDDTARFFWLPLTNGSTSSGGRGPADGENGWSNAIGFSNRNNSPAPDGYKFFSYCYHMDQEGEYGDLEMTDAVVQMEQWNTIQGHVKCNTYQNGEANPDGIMRYWVNGDLAYENESMRFTVTDNNRIEGCGPMGYFIGNIQGTYYYDNHQIWINPEEVPPSSGETGDQTQMFD